MPVSTTEVLTETNFLPVAEAKRAIEAKFGALIPQPEFRTNGPASYYRLPGRDQRIGFIGAMTNLHFCESCNKLRLTCDGKLRPCLGSYLEFDIMKPLRAGASDEELRAVLPRCRRAQTGAARFPHHLSAGAQDGRDRRLTMKRLTHIASDGSAKNGRRLGQTAQPSRSRRSRTDRIATGDARI